MDVMRCSLRVKPPRLRILVCPLMHTHPLRAVHSQAVRRRCRTTVQKIQGVLLDTFRDTTTDLAWAEDRATQRCDPSAGPGAKTGVRAELRRSVPLLSCPLRDWP